MKTNLNLFLPLNNKQVMKQHVKIRFMKLQKNLDLRVNKTVCIFFIFMFGLMYQSLQAQLSGYHQGTDYDWWVINKDNTGVNSGLCMKYYRSGLKSWKMYSGGSSDDLMFSFSEGDNDFYTIGTNHMFLNRNGLNVLNNLYLSKNNLSGGGLFLADDGSLVDNNDGYASMRFSLGVKINDGKDSNNTKIWLKNSGDIEARSFKVSSGTSSSFLKADGSLDSNNYLQLSNSKVKIDNNNKLQIGNYEASNAMVSIAGAVQIFPKDTSPTTFNSAYGTDYLLWVQKGIVTNDVAFAEIQDWADDVFKKEYKLLPLAKVNEFVKENGHLPNIPSEEEIKKEGYTIHSMTKKLLKKIEELTLYAIDQEAKLEQQSIKIEQLLKVVDQMQKK